MKIRVSNRHGCPGREKVSGLPEHHCRRDGLRVVTHGRRHTVSPILHLQSSSQQERPAPAEPTGTPWCWGLKGLEPTVMVPICPLALGSWYHGDAAGVPPVAAAFWNRKSGPAPQTFQLLEPGSVCSSTAGAFPQPLALHGVAPLAPLVHHPEPTIIF